MFFSKLSASLCAIGIAGTNALPSIVRSDYVYTVKERHPVPLQWAEAGPAPRGQNIHLQIGLKQSNEGLIEKHLLETSDPNHERYGQHLSMVSTEPMM